MFQLLHGDFGRPETKSPIVCRRDYGGLYRGDAKLGNGGLEYIRGLQPAAMLSAQMNRLRHPTNGVCVVPTPPGRTPSESVIEAYKPKSPVIGNKFSS